MLTGRLAKRLSKDVEWNTLVRHGCLVSKVDDGVGDGRMSYRT